jgi:carbonic anhydrase
VQVEMPVRTGMLDDKLLREVCRPESRKRRHSRRPEKPPRKSARPPANYARPTRPWCSQEVQTSQPEHARLAEKTEPEETRAPARAMPPATAATRHRIDHGRRTPAAEAGTLLHASPTSTQPASPAGSSMGESKDLLAAYAHAQIPLVLRRVRVGPKTGASCGPITPPAPTASGSRRSISATVSASISKPIQLHLPSLAISRHRQRPHGTGRCRRQPHRPARQDLRSGAIPFSPTGRRTHRTVKSFEMVIHLVHKSEDGELAVVAVLLEQGLENPLIQSIWNNLPLEKNEYVHTTRAQGIDLAQLDPRGPQLLHLHGLPDHPPLLAKVSSGWCSNKRNSSPPSNCAIFCAPLPTTTPDRCSRSIRPNDQGVALNPATRPGCSGGRLP